MSFITVSLLAYSVNPNGKTVASFEWEYPRFIHSEVMTHRALSKNAASSRAIPAKKVRKQVWDNPAMPVEWSKNQAGMSAKATLSSRRGKVAGWLWKSAARTACMFHWGLEKLGLHKQYINRILEPWALMKIVISGSEWNNFVWLRNHIDAQPELQVLGNLVSKALLTNKPKLLQWGEWHLPYIPNIIKDQFTLKELNYISTSSCAQVSYRVLDTSLEKAEKIVNMLTSGDRVHASPFEHQFKAVNSKGLTLAKAAKLGFTHVDASKQVWSGNACEWVQQRQLIPGHTVVG